MTDILERVKGIEPSSSGWKPEALPLSYIRFWLRGLDSNQRRHKSTVLQTAAFNHSATPPINKLNLIYCIINLFSLLILNQQSLSSNNTFLSYFVILTRQNQYLLTQKIVYINGATAVPDVKKSKAPNKVKIIIIGNNQNFFLTFKNLYISIKKLI